MDDVLVFFYKQKTAYEMRISDWSSDVCSSDLQNIAESLQRVTGVQISRNLGEGQFLSVRGLDPQFTNTLYNGRQLPSGSGTRAFDFQVLSANFASQVAVYKSPTADLLESRLAAAHNIQSIRLIATRHPPPPKPVASANNAHHRGPP